MLLSRTLSAIRAWINPSQLISLSAFALFTREVRMSKMSTPVDWLESLPFCVCPTPQKIDPRSSGGIPEIWPFKYSRYVSCCMVGTSSSPMSEFVTADRNRFVALFHCGRLKQTVQIQPVRESIIKFHIRDIRRTFVPDLVSDRRRVLFVERAAPRSLEPCARFRQHGKEASFSLACRCN